MGDRKDAPVMEAAEPDVVVVVVAAAVEAAAAAAAVGDKGRAWERVALGRDGDGQRLGGDVVVHGRALGLAAPRRGLQGGADVLDMRSQPDDDGGGLDAAVRVEEEVVEPLDHADVDADARWCEQEEDGDESEDEAVMKAAEPTLTTRIGAGVCRREVLDPCLRA